MAYTEKHLIPGESIIMTTRLHWIVFAWPVILVVVGLLARRSGVGMFLLVIGGLWFINTVIRFTSEEFSVTNRRVILKIGLLSQNVSELRINKLESFDSSQTLWGRMYGYGKLMVGGSGGTKTKYGPIDAFAEFKSAVHETASTLAKNAI